MNEEMNKIIREISVPLKGSGLNPFILDREAFYWIASGGVNVFCSCLNDDGSPGSRFFVAHFEEGEFIFPAVVMELKDEKVSLIADALPGSEILCVRKSVQEIIEKCGGTEWLAEKFHVWAEKLSQGLACSRMPYACRVISDNELTDAKGILNFESGTCFRPERGLVWVTVRSGFCVICGNEESMLMAEGSVFPLSNKLWLKALDDLSVEFRPTSDFINGELFTRKLKEFYEIFFRSFLLACAYRNNTEAVRRKELALMERNAMKTSLEELASLGRKSSEGGTSANVFSCHLFEVLEFVGKEQGIKFKFTENPSGEVVNGTDFMRRVLESSSVFYRTVKLSSGWWKHESGPVIVFYKDVQQPAGVIFDRKCKKHLIYAPHLSAAPFYMNGDDAGKLDVVAYVMYPQLPLGKLCAKDMLRLAFRGLLPPLKVAFLTGMTGGIISLIYPYVTGIVFNSVIPHAEYFQLWQTGIILVTATLSATVFSLGRSLAILRIKTLSDYNLQSAVVGRLMKMPLSFFKRFSTGELTQRVMGIDAIRKLLADNVSGAVFSLLFAIPSLMLMFYYSWKLSLSALCFLLIFFIVLCIVGAINAGNHKRELQASGELDGFTVQVLNGINKIRNSISEDRAFIRWALKFAEETRWHIRSMKNNNFLIIFDSFFPVLISCFFFYLVGETWRGSMNIGEYLAFNSAFTTFMGALIAFSTTLPVLMTMIPIYGRMKPLMETASEADSVFKAPGELDGRVEMHGISYRYTQDSPPALRNVSISAAPGEFVAIVGPSGAGKSTIARLLLGFETPESGGVYYSGQDINAINRRELRKQIGTVLQSGALEAGSIYENIAGSSNISMDDAWEAARKAGCDKDIEAMPMGMHTFVSSGTVSGGQKQRILIARALSRKPRIIIFDEATSAVDNETQAVISESLRKMNATRIVIAHRLSTIEGADKIYVLNKGELVETGTFRELINRPGVFSRLARRQMV
ncbi:MAG: NHLP bacteriocin export ABC transporter permease/ATPase subunit [Lentisphaerae bacterium GWF2_44_16]|nr:MAG: NHLP bacteriocin export ABC transporter permease/ATPase subunit [Lentisphaerae bacterium GWF2_44_16]